MMWPPTQGDTVLEGSFQREKQQNAEAKVSLMFYTLVGDNMISLLFSFFHKQCVT